MNAFQAALARIAAGAVQSVAYRQAERAPQPKQQGSSCTPCAAKAYVENIRAQYGRPPAPARGRGRR